MNQLSEKLKSEVMTCPYCELEAHLARLNAFKIHQNQDIVAAGIAIAQDDVQQIESWLGTGVLSRPSAEEMKAWSETPSREFRMLIVQPLLLIQPLES